MRKVEEFQETQKLIDEYNGFDNKVLNLEDQIKKNENKAKQRKVRLEQEMEITEEDKKLLNEDQIKEIAELYQKQIEEVDENLSKDNKEIEKQIEDAEDDKKYFRTDDNLKTITMEIEEMKKEVHKGELELKKKDIELEEFYNEEQHENPIRWQEIYNEKDTIKKDIEALKSKIDEYSKFKEALLSIELTANEYKIMFEREEEKAKEESPKTVGGEDKEQNNSTEDEPKIQYDDDSKNKSQEQDKQISTEPKENEFNWDNFIKQYGGDRTNTTNTNPIPSKPTNSNNKEDKIKQEMDTMWANREKEQAEKIKREEALGYEEYKQQQKANEREETPEEIEATKKWLSGEELEEIKSEKIRDPKTEEEKDLVKKAELRRKMQNEPEKVGRTTQGYKDFVKQQEEIVKAANQPKGTEGLIFIEFDAKKQSYKLINMEKDDFDNIEIILDDFLNSEEVERFEEEVSSKYREELLNDIDPIVAYMINEADKQLKTKKLENYIAALNGKEKLAKDTNIHYKMDGIYGRKYSKEQSDVIMEVANKHVQQNLATSEKNRWTKFLESKMGTPLRNGIFKAREIMNKIKKFPSSKKNNVEMLSSGSNIKSNIEAKKHKLVEKTENIADKNETKSNQITDKDIEKANKRKEEKVEKFVLNIDPKKIQSNSNQTITNSKDSEIDKILDEVNNRRKNENNSNKTTAKSNDAEVSNIINEVKQKQAKEVIGGLNETTSNSLKDRVKVDQDTVDKTNKVGRKYEDSMPNLENIINEVAQNDVQKISEGR